MAPAAARRGRGGALSACVALVACRELLQAAQGPLGLVSECFAGAGARRSPATIWQAWRTRLAARGGGADATALEIGDKVKAQSPDDEAWYSGRINVKNADGTCVVAWDDPDGGPEWHTVAVDNIKKLSFFRGYQVGDDCKALSPDDATWYPGTVAELLGDDKFRVKWDDPDEGAETADVDLESIRRVRVKRDYEEGARVIAKSSEDGEWYDAEVLRRNEDGGFVVKWDDPSDGSEEAVVVAKDMKSAPIAFDAIQVGQKFAGVVHSVHDYGASVDIGAEVRGLVHVSMMSSDFVSSPFKVVDEDEEVTVWVSGKRLDPGDKQMISLSMIEGVRDAPLRRNLAAFMTVPADTWHTAVVGRVLDWGCAADITLESGDVGRGALKNSNMLEGHVGKLRLGQELKVRVLRVDVPRDKMALSMLEPRRGPRPGGSRGRELAAFEAVGSSEWLEATIGNMRPFGIFLRLMVPGGGGTTKGMVHVSQVPDGKAGIDKLGVGQKVKVRVKSVDAEHVRLTMLEPPKPQQRAAKDVGAFAALELQSDGAAGADAAVDPTRLPAGQLKEQLAKLELPTQGTKAEKIERLRAALEKRASADAGPWLAGKVKEITKYGAFVETRHPDGETVADGLVYIADLRQGYVESVADEVEVGQEVKVRVKKVDLDARKMWLTMKSESVDTSGATRGKRKGKPE